MKTTLDLALIRWSVVCKEWGELSSGFYPNLGAFLSGWFWKDMGNELPKELGEFRDSFRKGYQESEFMLEILNRERQNMKATEENLSILKKLGFTCDFEHTKNPQDIEWYSLKCGWGFRLDGVGSFKTLVKNMLEHKED